MKKDFFIISERNLRRRKTRSILTMVGIIISIATIFTLISLSLGLQSAIEEQFRLLGADKFFIQPKTSNFGPPGSITNEVLTEDYVDSIVKVRGVKDYSYMVMGNAKVDYREKTKYLLVTGIPLDKADVFFETGILNIEEGRNLERGDSGVVVVGNNFKEKVFGQEISIRNKLTINEEEFQIKGILETVGNPQDDQSILMPIDDFRELFNVSERVDYVIIQVQDENDLVPTAERVEDKLRDVKDQTEKNQDFSIATPEDLLGSFKTVLNIITAFLGGIAAISLLVGAVGIANTMYTSVIERTKEIGIMKAIGAKNSDVLNIFIVESGLLGLVGGVIGILFGMSVGKIIQFIAVNFVGTNLLQVVFPVYLVLGCLLFSILIGILSGLIPSYQASKTNVVDALRYE